MRLVVAILAATGALVWAAGDALACACCAEPGTWYQVQTPLGSIERDALAHLRFTTARAVPGPDTVVRSPDGNTTFVRLSLTVSAATDGADENWPEQEWSVAQ